MEVSHEDGSGLTSQEVNLWSTTDTRGTFCLEASLIVPCLCYQNTSASGALAYSCLT